MYQIPSRGRHDHSFRSHRGALTCGRAGLSFPAFSGVRESAGRVFRAAHANVWSGSRCASVDEAPRVRLTTEIDWCGCTNAQVLRNVSMDLSAVANLTGALSFGLFHESFSQNRSVVATPFPPVSPVEYPYRVGPVLCPRHRVLDHAPNDPLGWPTRA